MTSIRLTHFNSSFQVDDKHDHKKLIITKLDFSVHPEERIPPGIRLEIQDENEIILFEEFIEPFLMKELASKVAYIHREFAIFNHLTVRLATEEPDEEFEADVYFILSSGST